MPAHLAIRSLADAPHLRKAASVIEQAAWSHLGYLSYTRAHYEYYAELIALNISSFLSTKTRAIL
jgi:uncharacterized protein YjbK